VKREPDTGRKEKEMNYCTARNYAAHYAGNPTEGLLMLDMEQANGMSGPKWERFKEEATNLLEQIIKDAAIYAAMP